METNILFKRKTCFYIAFGLSIESELELEELTAAKVTPQVIIRVGAVPSRVQNPCEINEFFQASKNEFLMNVDGIGRYYVYGGREIIVEPYANASFEKIKVFILGTAFGALLLQRGIFPLHGSAMKIDDKCILFLGDSGSGKSTISTALRLRGHKLLSDDVIAIHEVEGKYWVYPSYPQQKLTLQSAEHLGVNIASSSKIMINEEREKYYVPVKSLYFNNPVPIGYIVHLVVSDSSTVELIEIKGLKRLGVILNNTYRVQLVKHFGLSESHFKACSSIALGTKVFCLNRPKNGMTVNKQIELVMKEIQKTG